MDLSRFPKLQSIGNRYWIKSIQDTGGQAVVYKAIDRNPPDCSAEEEGTPVAIKVYRVLRDDHVAVARLAGEVTALQALRHPNIVRYRDHGFIATEDEFDRTWTHFFVVMDFLEDETSLREYVEQFGALSPRRVVGLILPIVSAVKYVHANYFVHGDISEANIRIRKLDGVDAPILIDFGLVRKLPAGGEVSLPSGTPEYMSPELVSERDLTRPVGPESDVWSLGVVLFLLVTGKLPFGIRGSDIRQFLQRVKAERIPIELLHRSGCPRALTRIIQGCLERDGILRWTSEELETHLIGFLGDQKHYPPPRKPMALRWKVWKNHHPIFLAGIAVAMVVCTGLLPVVVWKWNDAANARSAEEIQRKIAQTQTGIAAAQAAAATEMQIRAERENYHATLKRVELLRQQGISSDLGGIPTWLQGWETAWIRHESRVRPLLTAIVSPHDWPVLTMAVRPDGAQVVTAGSDCQLLLSDLKTGHVLKRLYSPDPVGAANLLVPLSYEHCLERSSGGGGGLEFRKCFSALSWLGNSSRILAASLDGEVCLIDVDSGDSQLIRLAKQSWTCAASDRSGIQAALGANDGLLVFDCNRSSETIRRFATAASVSAVIRRPADDGWIIGTADGWLIVLTDSLEELSRSLVPGPVWALDIAIDGDHSLLAVGAQDPSVILFSLLAPTGQLAWKGSVMLASAERQGTSVQAVRFMRGVKQIVAIDNGRRMVGVDLEPRRVLWGFELSKPNQKATAYLEAAKSPHEIPIPLRRLSYLATLPKTGEWLSASEDLPVRGWSFADSSTATGISEFPVASDPRIAFSSNEGRFLWMGDSEGILQVVDTTSNRETVRVHAHVGPIQDLVTLPQPNSVATIGADGYLKIWTLEGTSITCMHEFASGASLRTLAVAPEGQLACTVDTAGYLCAWDLQKGKLTERLLGDPAAILTGRLAFSPDGLRLAVFGEQQHGHIFNVPQLDPSGMPRLEVAGSGGTAITWLPMLKHGVAFADSYKRVVICDPWTGLKRQHALAQPNGRLVDLVPSADGRRLFGLEADRLHVLETSGWSEVFNRSLDRRTASRLATSPSNGDIAIAFSDGVVQLWQSETRSAEAANSIVPDAVTWNVEVQTQWPEFSWDSAIHFDEDDRPGILVLERPVAGTTTGKLVHAYLDRGRIERQSVDPDFWVDENSFVLLSTPGRPLCAVYRVAFPNSSNGPYDGELRMASRSSSNQWKMETAHSPPIRGNRGFWPIPVWSQERVQEILSFNYNTFSLVRDFRDQAGTWQSESIGHWGDGFRTQGLADASGTLHLIYSTNKSNTAMGNHVYARYRKGELVRALLGEARKARCIARDAHGTVKIVVYREATADGGPCEIGSYTADGTLEFVPIPGTNRKTIPFSCAFSESDDWILCLDHSTDNRRLRAWHRSGGDWRVSTVTDRLPLSFHAAIAIDSAGNPIVMTSTENRVLSWQRGSRTKR